MNSIIVTLDVEGIHHWPEAPDKVFYLQYPHRHMFHIRAEFLVNHPDRDLEFMIMKHRIDRFLRKKYFKPTIYMHDFGSMSCEMIAKLILKEFEAESVEVWEDKENGAKVVRSKR